MICANLLKEARKEFPVSCECLKFTLQIHTRRLSGVARGPEGSMVPCSTDHPAPYDRRGRSCRWRREPRGRQTAWRSINMSLCETLIEGRFGNFDLVMGKQAICVRPAKCRRDPEICARRRFSAKSKNPRVDMS